MPLALILAAGPAVAAIYKWVDEAGTVHFTDNLQQVPPRYRGQVRSMSDRLPPSRPQARIPLESTPSGYLVDVRLNGRTKARLVLDTGASATVLSRGVARRAGLAVRHDPPVRVQTAGGLVTAGWAEVDRVEVGGRTAGPLRAVIHDAVPGADGLLGMDFLGAFRVEIQADGPTLLLNPL